MGDTGSVLHIALAVYVWRIGIVRSLDVVHMRLGVTVYWYRMQDRKEQVKLGLETRIIVIRGIKLQTRSMGINV
jgi:hypothetical protein